MSVCLFLCLSLCLSVCMSVCFSVYLFVCLSVSMPVRLYVCLPVSLSVYLFLCLSICLSVCLFLYLFVCQSVCQSVIQSTTLHNVSYREQQSTFIRQTEKMISWAIMLWHEVSKSGMEFTASCRRKFVAPEATGGSTSWEGHCKRVIQAYNGGPRGEPLVRGSGEPLVRASGPPQDESMVAITCSISALNISCFFKIMFITFTCWIWLVT